MTDTARIALTTPLVFDPAVLAETLGTLLATGAIASVRIDLSSDDEADWISAANHLMPIAHAADVPCLVTDQPELVGRLGLDGAHLARRTGELGVLRKRLGRDVILGAEAGLSRHRGMTLAEAGADYVTIGPCAGAGAAEAQELLTWWAEMIETPSIADGVTEESFARETSELADFLSPHPDAIWQAPDPVAALKRFAEALR